MLTRGCYVELGLRQAAPIRLQRKGFDSFFCVFTSLGSLMASFSATYFSRSPNMSQEQSLVPFELRAINAETVGELLGINGRTVLETVACRPDFPVRISMRPATWVAGEVLAWRDANRSGRRVRRRRPDSA